MTRHPTPRLLAATISLTLATHARSDCAADLATLLTNGVTPPALDSYSFCNFLSGPPYVCDYYTKADPVAYAADCTAAGGDVINVATKSTCDASEDFEFYYPWCVPLSCDPEELLVDRREELSGEKMFRGCDVVTEGLDLCEHLGSFSHPDPTMDPWCEVVGGTSLVCDFYEKPGVNDTVSECIDTGSDSLLVTKSILCTADINRISTGPYCVPSGCDSRAILERRQAEEQSGAPRSCTVTITSPDVTPFPTVTPSHTPTVSPSKSPSTAPTDTPSTSLHPTVRPSATPSATPTAAITDLPTLTQVLCKSPDFLNGNQCSRLTAAFDENPNFELSDDRVCEDRTDPVVRVCDMYKSRKIGKILEACEARGGDPVSVKRYDNCTKEEITAPLCVPKGCETGEFIAEFIRSETEAVDASCGLLISENSSIDLPYCPATCIDRSKQDRTECIQAQYSLDRTKQWYDLKATVEQLLDSCTTVVTDTGTTTDCDLYSKISSYDHMERCKVLGGDNVKVTYTQKCKYINPDKIVVSSKTSPMCVPQVCEAYDFLPLMRDLLQHRKDNDKEVSCDVTLDYDLGEDLVYCDAPEPAKLPVLTAECTADLEVMQGNAPSIDDGYQKECTTLYVDGVPETVCQYHEGKYDLVMADCAAAAGTTAYETTTKKECRRYDEATLYVRPNVMCVPDSCAVADLTVLAIREEEVKIGPSCVITSEEGFTFVDAPPTAGPAAGPSEKSPTGDASLDFGAEPPTASRAAPVFGCYAGFVALGMILFSLGC